MLRVNLGEGALTARKIRWGSPGDRPVCPCIKLSLFIAIEEVRNYEKKFFYKNIVENGW